ncbi:MAG: ATP-binding cassette domain-containing protein [Chloroflexota bacterium]
MSAAIVAEGLGRVFRVQQKPPGIMGSLRSLFNRVELDVHAVREVTFTIAPGELIGFLGPNGAGKTTTLKMLAGLLHPTSGTVRVLGHEPYRRERAFQRRIALILGQKNQLWWDLPAIESFILNREIYGIPRDRYQATLGELVDLLDLGRILDVQVRKLSLGERMKCELAGALLHRPDLLFLDEPTIGLDVVMQQRIREFIAEYNRRHGATIILTSHYMQDVASLCRRVIVINQGKLVFDGGLDELVRRFANYKVFTVELGPSADVSRAANYGDVVSIEGTVATLRVPRDAVAERASALLASLDVLDLAIQDPEVEDVIRQVFGATHRPEDALAP